LLAAAAAVVVVVVVVAAAAAAVVVNAVFDVERCIIFPATTDTTDRTHILLRC